MGLEFKQASICVSNVYNSSNVSCWSKMTRRKLCYALFTIASHSALWCGANNIGDFLIGTMEGSAMTGVPAGIGESKYK